MPQIKIAIVKLTSLQGQLTARAIVSVYQTKIVTKLTDALLFARGMHRGLVLAEKIPMEIEWELNVGSSIYVSTQEKPASKALVFVLLGMLDAR